MAIFYENWDAYAVGSMMPLGVFIDAPFSHGTVQAGGLIGNRFGGGSFDYVGIHSDFTIYAAMEYNIWNSLFVEFIYGPVAGPFTILSVRNEMDSTFSLILSGGGGLYNSGVPLSRSGYNFIQINVQLTFWTDAGINKLTVDAEVFVNNVSVASTGGPVNTSTLLTVLDGFPQFDRIRFYNPGSWDEITGDSIQPGGTFPNLGSPLARVTTAVDEVVLLPNSASARVSLGAIEVVLRPPAWQVYEA